MIFFGGADDGERLDPGRVRMAAVAAMVVTGLSLVVAAIHFRAYEDDAYIFFRYAENLVRHGALEFNPGERVEGFTSPLWTLILAVTTALGVAPTLAAGLGCAFLATGTALLSLRDSVDDELNGLFVWLAPFSLVTCYPFALTSYSGMETALFGFLLWGTLVGYRSAIRRGGRPGGVTALLLALTCLARPEGALAAAVLVVGLALRASRENGSLRQGLTPVARWAAPAACVLLGWLCFRLLYYGDLLSNTAHVKRGGTPAHFLIGLQYLKGFAAASPLAWGLLLLPLLRILKRLGGASGKKVPATAELLTLAGLYSLYVVYVGGGGELDFRLLVPLLPLLYALGAGSLARAAAVVSARLPGPRLVSALAAGALVAAVVGIQFRPQLFHRGDETDWLIGASKLGRELRRRSPADTLVAASAIGALGYHSRRPILDLLGLVDRVLARRPSGIKPDRLRSSDIGHERFDIEWSMKRRPHVIVFMRAYGSRPFAHLSEVPATGDAERRLKKYLSRSDDYRLENVAVDQRAHWPVLLRKDFVLQADSSSSSSAPAR